MSNSFGAPPGQPGGQSFGTPPAGGFGQPQSSGGGVPVGSPGVAGGPPSPSGLSADGIEKATSLRGWMRIFGIINMVMGALYCASVGGIIFGWYPLLMGFWTFKAGDEIAEFAQGGDIRALERGISQLRNIYLAMGIAMIIGVSIFVLAIVAYILMFLGVFGLAALGAAQGS